MERLALVTCGGTIAMASDSDATRRPSGSASIVETVAAMTSATLSVRSVPEIDSSQATCETWDEVLAAVRSTQSDGPVPVVVTHGTDTLEWTAGALAVAGRWDVPVVLTGANVPLGERGSDATANLRAAVAAAGVLPPAVAVVFAGSPDAPAEVFQGGFVRKAVDPPQPFVALGSRWGSVVDSVVHLEHPVRPVPLPPSCGELPAAVPGPDVPGPAVPGSVASPRFGRRVELVHCHPALDGRATVARWAVGPRPDVVVLELYPCATAPEAAVTLAAGASRLGIQVWACPPLPVTAAVYPSTAALADVGAEVVLGSTVELLVPAAALRAA